MGIIKNIKSVFSKTNKQISETTPDEIYIRLNDKLLPVARGQVYEDPLEEYLKKNQIGEIVNSGTMQSKEGEILFCDIDISFSSTQNERREAIDTIVSILENRGAPMGSYVLDKRTGQEMKIGTLEGIGIYLNGTDLPEQVYNDSDINHVVEQLQKLLGLESQELRYWQGNTETALFFYGKSFENMREAISGFIASYPLCEKCRLVRIA